MGRDAKDVSREEALDYVAGYTAGNDVSSRKLQRDPELAGRIPQWGFSKGFDTFAPLGPVIVSSQLIPDPAQLHLKTIVDGETRQSESVSDLLFDCAYIVSYLSQGTTLQKGQVIMTGTPGGKFASSLVHVHVFCALHALRVSILLYCLNPRPCCSFHIVDGDG
jgi:2-keto-4-pentenoate hydratase/2-oxohepta-3-ene-1,7-dioic acid hydratase in catechol pathway